MARELYNWDQLVSYSIIAIHNLKSKNIEIDEKSFIREVNTLQTMYGKEGVIGLAQRYLKKEENI